MSAKSSKILSIVPPVAPSPSTVSEAPSLASILGTDTVSEATETALRAYFGAKAPRVAGSNPDSVAGLTALVPEALKIGLKSVKFHTSLFGTVAGGKAVLSALEARLEAARTISATIAEARAVAEA